MDQLWCSWAGQLCDNSKRYDAHPFFHLIAQCTLEKKVVESNSFSASRLAHLKTLENNADCIDLTQDIVNNNQQDPLKIFPDVLRGQGNIRELQSHLDKIDWKKEPHKPFWNEVDEQKFDKNTPQMILRIGWNEASTICHKKGLSHPNYGEAKNQLHLGAGVYGEENDFNCFSDLYSSALLKSTAVYRMTPTKVLFFEPFMYFLCGARTVLPRCPISLFGWYNTLSGCRVLIVSPFVDCFENQVKSGNWPRGFGKAFDHKKDHNIDFVWQKSVFSAGTEMPHSGWIESFEKTKKDIFSKRHKFDVALLSCGSYGLPLCDYIYKDLKKTAVYMGGHLQLSFCVIGSRWENSIEYYKKYPQYWVRPPAKKDLDKIENGCYC